MATQVTITTSELNLSATVLRSRLTDVVATRKLHGPESLKFRIAMRQFEQAVEEFKNIAF